MKKEKEKGLTGQKRGRAEETGESVPRQSRPGAGKISAMGGYSASKGELLTLPKEKKER